MPDGRRAAGPALRAALKKDPALAGEMQELISAAGAVLGMPPAEVLFFTGFERADRTPGRLEAALAELRAALFLRHEGFSGIRLVGRAAGRTADLGAARDGEEFLFEVRWVRGGFGQEAAKKLTAKCLKKSVQLRAGLKKSGAGRGGLIFVAEPVYYGPFRRSAALAGVAAAVKVPARRAGLHLCLISAGETAVHPAW